MSYSSGGEDECYAVHDSQMLDVIQSPAPALSSSNDIIPLWIQCLPEIQKTELAHALIRSLPTGRIHTIVEELIPRLHINPLPIFPPEISAAIFSHLDPKCLLALSSVSREWRARVSDPWLWRRSFLEQGWKADLDKVATFELAHKNYTIDMMKQIEMKRSRPYDSISDDESPYKRPRSIPIPYWSHAYQREGVSYLIEDEGYGHRFSASPITTPPYSIVDYCCSPGPSSVWPSIKPTLMLTGMGSSPKVNWQFLFKQKRRLENNWEQGKYKNFQLPHPTHPEEAHTECVYTIQFASKFLVSGSRDQTVRVWNLDTQRLLYPPLQGHIASVLCLQFDYIPHQDIIVSGGSDCSLMIWAFSNGRKMKNIPQAHEESILNLKFDDRYLVTCSKDRTIKVWNRHQLHPRDKAYPIRHANSAWNIEFADCVELASTIANDKTGMLDKTLPPFTHLMTLKGHTAAVNAVQIHGDQIVSASGDRYIKVWNIKTGDCLRTIQGHAKGIACVQYDGRRIISGSSDETIRVYDAITGAEIATLSGHTDLVRTVQASFGDTPHSQAKDDEDTWSNDYWIMTSLIRDEGTFNCNAAYGARLPPGGGGSKWARVVSGSYDETIIIWRRNAESNWVPAHKLTQWEGIIAAGGEPRFIPAITENMHLLRAQTHRVGVQLTSIKRTLCSATTSLEAFEQALVAKLRQSTSITGNTIDIQALKEALALIRSFPGIEAAADPLGDVVRRHFHTLGLPWPPTQATDPIGSTRQQQHSIGNIARQSTRSVMGVTAAADTSARIQARAVAGDYATAHMNERRTTGIDPHTTIPALRQAANTQQPAPPNARRARRRRNDLDYDADPALANPSNNRVYKLQFNSRRLICCSQDPTIVVWDFANGDTEIEIASEFFGDAV